MKIHTKEKFKELINESLTEFYHCPIGHQIYLRMTFYSNGAIICQIRYNDELISSINEENVIGANVLDYLEYNRDYGTPDIREINEMRCTCHLAT
jgi:hypothetical protein